MLVRFYYLATRVRKKSLKPEFDGLFCERIFGPIKDFECSCGKKPINLQKFCPNCDVEFTSSKKRRYQLGFIRLFNSAVHVWYLKGRPSYISILLNLNRRQAESLIYCTEFVLNNIFPFSSNSIFQQTCPPNSNFKIKYRNIKRFKKNLFVSRTNDFIDPFILKLTNSRFLSSGNQLGASEIGDFDQFKSKYSKNIHLNWDLIGDIGEKSLELFQLKDFLNSSQYWRLLPEDSLPEPEDSPPEDSLKKDLTEAKLEEKGGATKEKVTNSKNFTHSYYSISRYFCWEDSINSAHFSYYMTSLPEEYDRIMAYYYSSTIQQLDSPNIYNIYIGGQIFDLMLKLLSDKSKVKNLWALERQIRTYLFELIEFSAARDSLERIKLLRRLKLIWYFRRTKNQPDWMILSILPVLPPDLRPIIQLEGNQIAISDLNRLYQKVLFRNRRIQKLKMGQYSNTAEEMQYAQRLLQEAVDCLIENGKVGNSASSTLNNRPLKSLSDILSGKKGRFRQNLLGKRVDYSGRSVIVVGPHLKLHECGIPKEMALELFQPFLIRALVFHRRARTILGAKKLIEKGGGLLYKLLGEIIKNYPVLLNRAPTLHRMGIQSFQPILVDGRAIILHPLVCSSFNADFDGDQMAVHIPLSYQARSEAWKILWSQNNLLSPATGQPTLVPTQDMIIGWYYLTAHDPKNFYTVLLKSIRKPINLSVVKKLFRVERITNFYEFKRFKSKLDVILAYNRNQIDIHTPIWFYWKGFFEIEKENQQLLEIQLSNNGDLLLLSSHFFFRHNWYGSKVSQFIFTTTGRIIFNDSIK